MKLGLWIIFGYFLIGAIQAVLSLVVNLAYFGLSELGISYSILAIIIPALTIVLYMITTWFILKRVKSGLGLTETFLIEFPRKIFIGIILLRLTLVPLTNKLAGLYTEYSMAENQSGYSEYIGFYGWMSSGIYISNWLMILVLAIFFWKGINKAAE